MLAIAFIKAGGDIDAQLLGELAHREDSLVTVHRLRAGKEGLRLHLAEIMALKQLTRQDDLGAT